jgi:hypothetical protein
MKSRHIQIRLILSLAILAILAGSLYSTKETSREICGWYDNPTPGNFWLTDGHSAWVIGIQAHEPAEGLEHIPEFGEAWVSTNSGSYGYGCACMTVTVNQKQQRIRSIHTARVLPIAQCKNNPSLPQEDRPASTEEFFETIDPEHRL